MSGLRRKTVSSAPKITLSSVNNAFSRGRYFWLREERHQDEAQQNPEPLDEAAEVVAGGGEDGVVKVAISVSEIVAAHSVLVLEMADDGLDGRAATHLSFDRRGHAALLF